MIEYDTRTPALQEFVLILYSLLRLLDKTFSTSLVSLHVAPYKARGCDQVEPLVRPLLVSALDTQVPLPLFFPTGSQRKSPSSVFVARQECSTVQD